MKAEAARVVTLRLAESHVITRSRQRSAIPKRKQRWRDASDKEHEKEQRQLLILGSPKANRLPKPCILQRNLIPSFKNRMFCEEIVSCVPNLIKRSSHGQECWLVTLKASYFASNSRAPPHKPRIFRVSRKINGLSPTHPRSSVEVVITGFNPNSLQIQAAESSTSQYSSAPRL